MGAPFIIVAAASHSNVVYPFVVCPLNTFQVWKVGQLLTNKKSMESRKYQGSPNQAGRLDFSLS
jgi:hypothetical protein